MSDDDTDTLADDARKLKKAALLIKKSLQLQQRSTLLPGPLYNDPHAPALPSLEEKERLLRQLTKALRFTLRHVDGSPQLKEEFKKKQTKVAHVLKKTLDELKECKDQLAEVQKQCAAMTSAEEERSQLIADQWRLFDGLKRALTTIDSLRRTKGLDVAKETERLKTQLRTELEHAEKQHILLKSRFDKEKESQTHVKKSFEEILAKLKSDSQAAVKAAEEKLLAQEESSKSIVNASSDLKKQVALLKAHLEAALVDNKRLSGQIAAVRKNETQALEERLQQLTTTLEEKEDELTQLHRHLGKKLQEMAELQERQQSLEERLTATESQLSENLALIDVLKSERMKEEQRLSNELLEQKNTVDELQLEIERLRKVEVEWDRMAHSITQLQQNLRPA